MRVGLESVGDLVRHFNEKMAAHVPGILSFVIESLRSSSLTKELRASIFMCLGDIAIGCPNQIKQELDGIFELYILAFDAIMQLLSTKPDKETLDFVETLELAVIESLNCMVHGLLYNEQACDLQSHQQVR